MPVPMLKYIEPQENIEERKAQLKAELDECTEVPSTYRNKVQQFMVQENLWHISELDYHTRQHFEDFLTAGIKSTACFAYLKSFDRIKQHSVQQSMRIIAKGKIQKPSYTNKILFLPYHPNPEIAMRFEMARDKENLVWDFERKAPEQLKRQVYDILHHALENNCNADTLREYLLGLHELYDFCTENRIADIETLEPEDERRFLCIGRRKLLLRALMFSRKVLFLQAEEINWDAHVWFMERIHLQPERTNAAKPVTYINFLGIPHKRNRELLKQYIRYGLGITNLSVSSLRTQQIYIKDLMAELNQEENEDICTVTTEQIDAYLKKESSRLKVAKTYNGKVMCILQFFNFLKVRGYIERIPFEADYYLKKVIHRHNDRSVSEDVAEEILQNLQCFPEVNRLMFLHLWGIGLRLSEVCALKGNAYYIQGEDTWMQVYQTKMRNYKRIPIPSALYKLMKVYLKKYDIKAYEYVFKNAKGEAYNTGTFTWQMQKICDQLQIQNGTYKFKSHDFRHTIATYFYDTGVPIQSIRDYLGHDYEEMTQQYIDFMPKKIDKASEEYFSNHSLAACLRKGVKKDGK